MSKQYLIEFQISVGKRKEREQILNGEKKAAPAVEKMNKIKAAGRRRQNAALANMNRTSSSGKFEYGNSAFSMPLIPSASSPPRSPKASAQDANEDELLPSSPSSKEKLSIVINSEPGASFSNSRPGSRSSRNQDENNNLSPQDRILQKLAASPYRTSTTPHSLGKSPKLRPLSQSTSSVLRLHRMVAQLEKSPLPESTLQPPPSPTGRRPPHRSESDLQQMLHLTGIYQIPLQEIETQVSSTSRPSSPLPNHHHSTNVSAVSSPKHTPSHKNNRPISGISKRPASASSAVASNVPVASTSSHNSRPNSGKQLVTKSLTSFKEESVDGNNLVNDEKEHNQQEISIEKEESTSCKEGKDKDKDNDNDKEEITVDANMANDEEKDEQYEDDDFYGDDFEETNVEKKSNHDDATEEEKERIAPSSSEPIAENEIHSKESDMNAPASQMGSSKETEKEHPSSPIQAEERSPRIETGRASNEDVHTHNHDVKEKNDVEPKDHHEEPTEDPKHHSSNGHSGKFDRSQVFPPTSSSSSKPTTTSSADKVRKSSSFTTSSLSVPHYTSVASSSSSAKVACPSFYRSAKALEKDIFRLAQIEAGVITAEEWRRQQQAQHALATPPAWDSRIVTATSLLAEQEIPKLGHEKRRENVQQHLAQLKKKVEERELKTKPPKKSNSKHANDNDNDNDNVIIEEDVDQPKRSKKHKRTSKSNKVVEEPKFDKSVKRLSFDSKRKSLEKELGIAVREPMEI